MNKRRSFFQGMTSLLDGFASLGEGMANIFAPPRLYSRRTALERLNTDLKRQGLRPLASSVDEALRSDWDAVNRDFAAVGEDMHHVMRDVEQGLPQDADEASPQHTPSS